MDVVDNAQRAEQLEREAALAALPKQANGPSLTHCDECGAPIPEARRAAIPGCKLCINCQAAQENL